jgi:hypothetical protein
MSNLCSTLAMILPCMDTKNAKWNNRIIWFFLKSYSNLDITCIKVNRPWPGSKCSEINQLSSCLLDYKNLLKDLWSAISEINLKSQINKIVKKYFPLHTQLFKVTMESPPKISSKGAKIIQLVCLSTMPSQNKFAINSGEGPSQKVKLKWWPRTFLWN